MNSVVSVVIVNHNSGDYLPRCLDSLRAQTWRDSDVILVDNTSVDSSMGHLERYPEVRVIRNTSNRGFAAAQNQGIALAKGRYLLSLNFDVILTPTFLERLVGAIQARPDVGWACGQLLNTNCDGTLADTLYGAGHALPPDRFPLLRGNGERPEPQYDQAEYVFGAPGAAALYRREMVEDVSFCGQFFDESFFLWYEDVDVDWRAQNRGWRCTYEPRAVAYHRGHVGEHYSEPFRSFHTRLTIRNRWLMIAANERRATVSLRALLEYELSLLFYVLRSGQAAAYLRAMASFAQLLGCALHKRRATFNAKRH